MNTTLHKNYVVNRNIVNIMKGLYENINRVIRF